jgi:hypothetical protein
MRKAMLLLAFWGFGVALWAKSPFDGTWKMNLSLPPTTILIQNGTYQCSGCNGIPGNLNIKADGTDQAVAGSNSFDTLAIKVLDDKTIQSTAKKGGKVVLSEKDVLDSDGKTVIVKQSMYSPNSTQPITMKLTLTRVEQGPAGSHAISGSWHTNIPDALAQYSYRTSPDGLIMVYRGESYVAKFDGNDYPYKGNPNIKSVSLSMENDKTMVETYKRDGRIVQVVHVTASADGKTLTAKAEDKEKGTTTTSTSTRLGP